jgi:DNA-binding beta-propeller fold protein YncE
MKRLFLLLCAVLGGGAAQAEPLLWQTNSEGDDIHVFSLEDFRLVARLETGPQPHGIAAPRDGSVVFVSVEANGHEQGELLWIDPRSLAIRHRLAVGPEPHAIAATPDGRWVYVPCRDGHYWVVDAQARTVVKRIRTGGRPHNTQASGDGRFMYLSPMGEPKGVTVVDVLRDHEPVGFIAFSGSVRPAALSADGSLLLQQIDGLNGFEVADTRRREVIATVRHSSTLRGIMLAKQLGYLGVGGFSRCHGLAIRPDQREIWSTCAGHLAIHRLEAPAFPETGLVELDGKGYWLGFSPDSRHAFVALSGQNRVAVIDVEARRVERYLAAGRAPKRNLILPR